MDEFVLRLLQVYVAHDLRTQPGGKVRMREAIAHAREAAHTYLLARAADVDHATDFGMVVTKRLPPCPGFRTHLWRANGFGCRRCQTPDVRAEVRREKQRALMYRRRRLKAV